MVPHFEPLRNVKFAIHYTIYKWVQNEKVYTQSGQKKLFPPEKETQKGKMKNTKVQKSKRCENVKSNNRIIQKVRKWKI